MKYSNATCSVKGCSGTYNARGLCKKHYDRKLYEVNQEKRREHSRKYYAANLEKEQDKRRQRRKANLDKVLEEHRKYRDANPGLSKKFRDANPEYYRKWRKANQAKELERNRKYRKANPAKERERRRKYLESNLERVHKQKQKWAKNNPEKVRVMLQRRRAVKLGASGKFVVADWRTLIARSERCHWCKKPWTKTRRPTHDHVVALSKGGANNLENSVCACSKCNSRKGDRRVNPNTGQGILI